MPLTQVPATKVGALSYGPGPPSGVASQGASTVHALRAMVGAVETSASFSSSVADVLPGATRRTAEYATGVVAEAEGSFTTDRSPGGTAGFGGWLGRVPVCRPT